MGAVIPQLRVRTEFSFRAGFGPTATVAAALQELNTPAAGIVDGGTWGHALWAKHLDKVGVKPMFGVELVVPTEDGRKPVAWVLAEDIRQFYHFSTAARQPDADIPALFKNSPGIIRFSGAALTNPDTFDYVDLNPASPLQQRAALRLAERTGKPLVITSDNAYPRRKDYPAFMAIASRERVTPQHILDKEELWGELGTIMGHKLFDQAVENTFLIAQRCASTLPVAQLIHFDGDLRALAEAGKRERLALGHIAAWDDVYEARLQRELATIAEKKFESYFLVVADLIAWAKQRMLVGPGRGSSAGSLVCYLLRITEIDPLPHNLLFERFIDLNRNDLPDIDIDFSDSKREQVFVYLAEKYGADKVARIGNINTLRAKSVIAKVVERLAIPEKEKYDVLNVLIDYSSGDSRYGHSLEDTMTQTEPGKRFIAKYPNAAVMFELENHASHTGVHAAGVIVCNEPISDFCTVGADGVAQLDKPYSETVGLLKIDALGLRTLGVIEDAGVVTADELYALKLDDQKVFDLFNTRRYAGIFQFEGQAQRRVAAEVIIDSFRKIDHVTALARPGPLGGGASQHYIARAAGREAVTYRHPSMADYLGTTFGVVLYQEDVMRIVREIGQFDWEATSAIRKAMSGRKGKEYFDQRRKAFVEGAATIGMDAESATIIWEEICSFGAWCISGETMIQLPTANQHSPREISIKELYENIGYAKLAGAKNRNSQKKRTKAKLWSYDFERKKAFALPLIDVIFSGEKETWRITVGDKQIRTTPAHKFLTPSGWKMLADISVGDEVAMLGDSVLNLNRHKSQVAIHKNQSWRKTARLGIGIRKQFETAKAEKIATTTVCEDCGKSWTDTHHNDGNRKNNVTANLSLLCKSCHRLRHSAMDGKSYSHKNGKEIVFVPVTSIGEPKIEATYDVMMPAPNHNFEAAGFIVHNCMNKSHTTSYGVISYWCGWMKTYHGLAYAAACLRNVKDDEQAFELLRDMRSEGIEYDAFDVEVSDIDWAVVNGRLVGGFMNLEGYGPAKARAAVTARKNGKLDREKIAKAVVKFGELYPLNAAYGDIYANPEGYGCRAGSIVYHLDDMPDSGDVLTICKVQRKELRDENEERRVARRDGKRFTGQTLFADIHVTDDSGIPVTLRFDRFDFEPAGRLAAERLEKDDALLIRGKRIPNFAMIKVKRIKCLNREIDFGS